MAGFGARLAEGLVIRVIRFPGRTTGNLTRQDEAAVVLHYLAAQGCEFSLLGCCVWITVLPDPLADVENGGKRPVGREPYNSFALQETRGSRDAEFRVFPSSSRHLLSFSLIASGEEVSSQLMAMAHDYMTNADAIEADSKPRLAAIIAQDASPDLETNGPQRARDTTGFVGPNQPHSEEDGRVAQSVERVCEQHETVVRIHSPAANCVLSTTVTERYVSHALPDWPRLSRR